MNAHEVEMLFQRSMHWHLYHWNFVLRLNVANIYIFHCDISTKIRPKFGIQNIQLKIDLKIFSHSLCVLISSPWQTGFKIIISHWMFWKSVKNFFECELSESLVVEIFSEFRNIFMSFPIDFFFFYFFQFWNKMHKSLFKKLFMQYIPRRCETVSSQLAISNEIIWYDMRVPLILNM